MKKKRRNLSVIGKDQKIAQAWSVSSRILLSLILLLSSILLPLSAETYAKAPEATEIESEEAIPAGLDITALDVGQGLSLLIEADGHAMIYDGGGRDRSSYVVSYLKKRELTQFDYMFASHYDEDHIAGLIGCLNNFAFGQVICPDYEDDTKIYTSFLKNLLDNGAPVCHPQPGDCFPLGNAIITVIGPDDYTAALENDKSIALRITYGAFSCVITGDAETAEVDALLQHVMPEDEAAELPENSEKSGDTPKADAAPKEISENQTLIIPENPNLEGSEESTESESPGLLFHLKSDVYFVGHHGSAKSTSEALLKAISPKAVVISCGQDNKFGHPAQETMELFDRFELDVYRTDKQKEITCHSDGVDFAFSTEPCEDHSWGKMESDELLTLIADTESENDGITKGGQGGAEAPADIMVWVSGKGKKYHSNPSCSNMKKAIEMPRSEAEASGRDACAKCW